MGRLSGIIIAIILCLPAFASAQQVPAATPPAPGAGHMQLNVEVTDKSGKVVPGLEAKDFTLLDNGQPSKILFFQAFAGTSEEAVPGVEVTLILDNVNVEFDTITNERQQLVAYLRRNDGHLAQPVVVLLYSNKGMKVLNQPSKDGNALAAQLEAVNLLQHSLSNTVNNTVGGYNQMERFHSGVNWTKLIANNYAKRPGRKLLIWIGPGWPMLDYQNTQISEKILQDQFNSIVELSTRLREAQAVLYSVSMDEDIQSAFLYQSFLKPVKKPEKADPPYLGLKVLAVQSGGMAVPPNNSLASQIDKCIQDGVAFYSFSFDSPHGGKPNDYHDLKVQMHQPGLTARTNTGYYTQP